MADQSSYGCIEGYIFHASSGECCSRDYVKVNRVKGHVIDVTCSSYFQSGLGRSMDKPSPYLRGVRLCNNDIRGDAHSCPGGMWMSGASLNSPELRLKTCCRPRYTRDVHNVCTPFNVDFTNRKSSNRYWAARMIDGCERKGERGRCCENKHEFRLWDGTCSSLRMIGPIPATARELLARRRSDGCHEDEE
ncbi:hypothetical protein CP532_1296 [Ophiocordyceps camponoti-leonardi (nom. inval.)]|nr:hypothetical protein CP532_1296 [Ophiocordyceps camponoti-leonardi (nom. inval.)]